jgi:hypothetical protein
VALLTEAQALDAESVPLLEAWLDRTPPRLARRGRPPPPPAAHGQLTRAEALDILGLAEGADEAAIRAAHRRLMQAPILTAVAATGSPPASTGRGTRCWAERLGQGAQALGRRITMSW